MSEIDVAKDAVARGVAPPMTGVHPDVTMSWERSVDAVGSPWEPRVPPRVDLSGVDSTLDDLLRQPLTRMAETLDDSGVALILADVDGRVLRCWESNAKSRRHMERASTGPGSVVAESVVGTNAAGTALVTGRPMLVRGAEHFAALYQDAACAAAPISHPVTGLVHGVVVLGTRDRPEAQLLLPMIKLMAANVRAYLGSKPDSVGALRFADVRRLPTSRKQPRTLIQQLEIDAILEALAACDGLRESAARRLGWSRSTLYRKMREYRIEASGPANG